MKTRTNKIHLRRNALVIGFMLGMLSLETTTAAIIIDSTVNFNGGTSLYEYSYSVQNTGDLDLVLISLNTNTQAAIASISPPTGFSLTFDPSQGVINFFEDSDLFTNQTFAGNSTVSPFTFTSPLAPVTTSFVGFDNAGNEFTGTTQSPIPEPSAILLGSIAVLATAVRRRRH
jgi:hypothetical protein